MPRSASGSRPSMADVARLSDVSTMTVSRYFTGSGYVSDAARQRIASAIEQLGYRPNQSARSLRSQRTNTVGVLSMGALNYGSAEVLTGLSKAAREASFTLSIIQLDLDFESPGWKEETTKAVGRLLSIPVDGIVLSTPVLGADELLTDWARSIPVITISERPRAALATAGTHSYSAGRQATDHLVGLGHTAILHVAGPTTRNEASERERGYRDAMAAAGLEPYVLSEATDWTASSGHRAGRFAEVDRFTAAFCANDELALGFLNAMDERGLHAPGDFSIVGVDDMPSAAYFLPALTTVRLDFRTLGARTFELLHARITNAAEVPEHFVIEPELVVRRSSAAPHAR